jgi:hypothetical protein
MRLEDEELKFIQECKAKINLAKNMIADLEIKKHDLMMEIQEVKRQFKRREKDFINKYGLNSVVNTETGEVQQK